MTALTREALHTRALHAIGPDEALIVPLTFNRKHVLPAAAWGKICTDDLNLTWGAEEITRFQSVVWLQHRGIPAAALRDQAPPYRVVARLSPNLWGDLQTHWDTLKPWREQQQPWLTLATKLISRMPA